MKRWSGLFFLLIAAVGCEKNIDFQPIAQTPLLVVDGTIESGQPPQIILSSSLNYFTNINPQILAGSFVHNAKITMTDGIRTHDLKEYEIIASNGYKFYFYSNDLLNPAAAFIGQFGKRYDLRIETSGQVYNTFSTIPLLTKKTDSLWWRKAPANVDSNKVVLMSRVTDPPGLGNYIRYFTKANSGTFLPGANSVFDDQIIDGKTYETQVDQGVDRNNILAPEEYGYFKRGDTVTLKLCNIDKATFDFWRTWEFAYQSIGNPFSSPGKIISNVSNGALGSFCGYSVQLKTLIIPK